MRDYSFILTSPSGAEQLYRLGQFPDSEHAFCLAELIASELSLDENAQWRGWMLEVRDCEGAPVFFSPVTAGHGDDLRVTNGAVEIATTLQAA